MVSSFSVALGAKHDQWYKLEWTKPQVIGGFVYFQPDRYTKSFDVEALVGGKWVTVAHLGQGSGVPGLGFSDSAGSAVPVGPGSPPPTPILGRNVYCTFPPVTTAALRLNHIESTEVGGAAWYEIEIYSDPKVIQDMQNKMDIAVSGDTTGRLIGTVSKEGGSQGIVGASVVVKGDSPTGSWERTATTGEHGVFTVALPMVSGKVSVTATSGDEKGALTVDATDLPLRLTPRPTEHRLSLDGPWEFVADPPEGFPVKASQLAWKPITVPSNYEMEGYRTKTDTAAMRKTFTVPADWQGQRIKLRAEAIYSHAEIWCNGKRVGSHEGGATPFELDLTDAAKPGSQNELLVRIIARSQSAKFDNISSYACFEVAGIWRPIEVFAVEPTHLARATYATTFDEAYINAKLSVDLKVANEGPKGTDATISLHLVDAKGKKVELKGCGKTVSLGPWEATTVTFEADVKKPEQWNAEQPRNYKLVATLDAKGQKKQIVEQPLGFRQVEIKGRCFSINGKPVRLFGACLHTADPFKGRAISVDLVRQDLELMKGANLNAIRTSHYPPHPATPAVADEKGLYIEDEGPSCWADGSDDLRNAPLYMGIVCEYVERDRNHPSVVYWSTCNESRYGIMFQLAHRYVQKLDPTRPTGGSYAPEDMDNDVYVIHHPTNIYDHIEKTKDIKKPVFYDECLTVPHGWGDYAYSLEIDPGMHDMWDWRVLGIRRQEMKYENQVGTMIWAWVDDAALIPGRGVQCWRSDLPEIRYTTPIYKMPGRGYQGDCAWGVVDTWRRPRPEWWLMKKTYTPALIEEKPIALPAKGRPIVVPIENLNWFTNLDQYECRWEIAGHRGVARASVAPSTKGMLELVPPVGLTGDETLSLSFHDETGRMVDAYKLRFAEHPKPAWKLGKPADLREENDRYLFGALQVFLTGNGCELGYDRRNGHLSWGLKDNEQVLTRGPQLHLLKSERPTGDDPVGWKFTSETHEPGLIRWNGSFGDELEGGYEIRMDQAGQIEIAYKFTFKGPDTYCREVGLEFELPPTFDRLSWDRKAEHSVYTDDHIGRPVGSAVAHPPVSQSVPPKGRPFGLDDHQWGCNDFRSAKRNVYTASLKNAVGQGVEVVSDGTQTVRCAVGVHTVSLKVLDYWGGSGGPKEWSVGGFHYGAGRLLKTGEVVQGVVRLRLVGTRG